MKKISQPLHSLRRRVTATVATALLVGASTAYANNADITSLLQGSQPEQALKLIDQRLSATPKDPQLRFLQGVAFAMANKNKEAIDTFTQLTKEFPELPEPYNNLAVLYAQQKQYDKARTALEMAIRTHPSYAIAYENLGDVYAKLASQAYDKALQLDNSNSATQNKLALIRDLITTSGKGNVKPQPATPAAAATPAAQPAPAPVAAKPAPAPATATATVVAATQGAAAVATQPAKAAPAPVSAPAATPAPAPAPVAAAPAPSKPAASAASDDVAKAINAWADAWSRKDMRAYLGAYASDFDTPKGMSRKAWEQEREQRIAGKGGKISVSVDNPQITINGDKATAKFRQHYKATGLSSSTSKTLILVRSGSKWLIKEENAR